MSRIALLSNWYSSKLTLKNHVIMMIFFLITYFGLIIFAFVPLSNEIEKSGYSTADLQNASDRNQIEIILTAFEPYVNEVQLLTFFDYMFIIAGVGLAWSIFSIIRKSNSDSKFIMRYCDIGFIITAISRSLDALENLFVILIYSNKDNFQNWLISAVNSVEDIKWVFVTIEYILLFITILFHFLFRFSKGRKKIE